MADLTDRMIQVLAAAIPKQPIDWYRYVAPLILAAEDCIDALFGGGDPERVAYRKFMARHPELTYGGEKEDVG